MPSGVEKRKKESSEGATPVQPIPADVTDSLLNLMAGLRVGPLYQKRNFDKG